MILYKFKISHERTRAATGDISTIHQNMIFTNVLNTFTWGKTIGRATQINPTRGYVVSPRDFEPHPAY